MADKAFQTSLSDQVPRNAVTGQVGTRIVCRDPDWPGYNTIYSATVKAKPQSMIGARTGCPGVALSTSFPLLITAVPFTSTYTMPSLGVVGFS